MDEIHLAATIVNPIDGRMNAIRDRMNAIRDGVNLAWGIVNLIHGWDESRPEDGESDPWSNLMRGDVAFIAVQAAA